MNDIFYSRQTQCPTRCKPNKKVPNYRMKSCQLSIKKSLRTKDYLYPKAWDRHPQPWDRYPQPWDMCPQPANKDYRFIRSISKNKYTTPTVITATAPLCPTASLAKPIAIGNTVPPKSPIIIKPETSFFFCGIASNAWEKITGKMFELPKPIRAMQMYIIVFSWKTNNPTIAANIHNTLMPKKVRGAIF